MTVDALSIRLGLPSPYSLFKGTAAENIEISELNGTSCMLKSGALVEEI